jgi:hypothetical protein
LSLDLVRLAGGRVAKVPGSVRNLKLTTPEDIAIAEALLRADAHGSLAREAPRRSQRQPMLPNERPHRDV